MEHRMPDITYSDPPMSRMKRWALRIMAFVLAILAPVLFYLLDLTMGRLNLVIAATIFFAIAFVTAIWRKRRKRRVGGRA
jgi:Flp pilus assembly protein TadB